MRQQLRLSCFGRGLLTGTTHAASHPWRSSARGPALGFNIHVKSETYVPCRNSLPKHITITFCLLLFIAMCLVGGEMAEAKAPEGDAVTVARLKYRGGGDWYNDPSMIPNLLKELHIKTGLKTADEQSIVSLSDDILFSYPVLFITGHGNIRFDGTEAERLRIYLDSGGFLIADDDYGMDESFRREMTRIFPDAPLVELPFSHPLYHTFYDFTNGPPKIHEHYEGPPKGFGIFRNGRLVVYYTYNSNISDGWADPDVHRDSPAVREQALKIGINIMMYVLTR